VQVRQNDVRNQFPGLSTPGGTGGGDRGSLEFFTSHQIGSPATNWAGQNRGGYVNGDMDRLWQAYNVTLDQGARYEQAAQMMKTVSDDVPGWPLMWDFNVMAYLATVRGPDLGIFGTSTAFWNVHEWEMR